MASEQGEANNQDHQLCLGFLFQKGFSSTCARKASDLLNCHERRGKEKHKKVSLARSTGECPSVVPVFTSFTCEQVAEDFVDESIHTGC